MRKDVCGVVGDRKWTVALLAGYWEIVVVWLSLWVETDTFGGGWRCVLVWGLETPEGASTFPGCADEGVVNVDAEDAVCAPCVS